MSLASTHHQRRLHHLCQEEQAQPGKRWEAAAGFAEMEDGTVLTFIHIDVVLPLFLVTCTMVPGSLHDVRSVPDVVPNRHLFQATV